MSLTWTLRSPPATLAQGPMACNPITGTIVMGSAFGFYRSTDGAQTWTALNPPPNAGGGSASVAFGGGNFIAYDDGNGMYRSLNDGVTWTAPATPPSGLASNHATLMAFSPTLGSGSGMWMLVQNTGFSTSVDGGNTWTALTNISSMSSGPANTNNLFWDGTQFAFSGRDAANMNSVIAHSSDGATWSLITVASIFGPDEIYTMTYASGQYLVGMNASHHIRQATTLAGIVSASDTDLASVLSGGTPVSCVFTPDGRQFVAAISGNGSSADVIAESDSAGGPWILSPPPAGYGTNQTCEYWCYDNFHSVLVGSIGGASNNIITAPYVIDTVVPNVVGLTQSAATLALTAAELLLGPVSSAYSPTVAPGLVVFQIPVAGALVPPASQVAITLSLGSPGISVPDVIGLTAAQAESVLAGAQLTTGAISGVVNPNIAIGSVGTQDPVAGTIVVSGSAVNLGISFIAPEFDVDVTVISQYANSPTILAMVENFAQYFDPAQNLQNFYLDVWNIDTAIGFGLDIWGIILGVSRVIPIPGSSGTFGFENADSPPDWENFGNPASLTAGGPFFSGQVTGNSYKLNDGPYRTLLLTKAFANICTTTAPALNALITNLFPGRGKCFTQDIGHMQMAYIFDFTLSTIEHAILAYSGVLAHPAGVGVNINVNATPFFGFAEALPGIEPFNFGSFFSG